MAFHLRTQITRLAMWVANVNNPTRNSNPRSLGNGVRKNGVRNRCPYRQCGVDSQEWPWQTKPRKGQSLSRGHSGTKVQCESCLFFPPKKKQPEFTKMDEIHELSVYGGHPKPVTFKPVSRIFRIFCVFRVFVSAFSAFSAFLLCGIPSDPFSLG